MITKKTCVKSEMGKLKYLARFITKLREIIIAIPTFNNETRGMINERKTSTNTIKIKIMVITAVFFIPSSVVLENSSANKVSLVTYVCNPSTFKSRLICCAW